MTISDSEVHKVLKELKCDWYDIESTANRSIVKIKTSEDRRGLLSSIEEILKKKKLEPGRILFSNYSSLGHVKCGRYYFVVKPSNRGPTENLKLKASNLAAYGEEKDVKLFGNIVVPCYTHSTPLSLSNSILTHLEVNENISTGIAKTFKKFFLKHTKTPTLFSWDGTVLPSEKNELGKYLGEILIGYQSMTGNLIELPKAKKFILPISSCFPGVDCAIMSSKKLIPISNKFGVGAKSTFFANILDKVVDYRSMVGKNWALYPVLKSLDQVNGDIKRTKELIYEYGINHYMNLGLEDPYSVYKDLVLGKISSNVKKVVGQLKHFLIPDSVVEYLKPKWNYAGLTSFFTRALASNFNNCKKSLAFMTDIISAKDFYQANLNIAKWTKGEILFDCYHSGGLTLKFYGDKFPVSDVTGHNGLLTYTLRPNAST